MEDFTKVIEEMKPMIHSIIRSLHIYRNYEEFYQTGLIGLWKAYESFDPEKGSFVTYAYAYIRGVILTELRKEINKEKRESFADGYFLESIVDVDGQSHEERLILKEAIERLPPRYQRFLELYIGEGLRLNEIAEELGISYRTARAWKQKIIEMLRNGFVA